MTMAWTPRMVESVPRVMQMPPIFRGFECLEIVAMLRELVEQCFAEAPEPLGMPHMLSRCILAGMLHNCAEMVSLGLAGERGVSELQNTPIADVEVPATQTPPPPDPAHWPKDVTYRRNEQGTPMKGPPPLLQFRWVAKAKGDNTPPPKWQKKLPPPKPMMFPGITVKQPPDAATYPVKPASAAVTWLDPVLPPTPPSGQSQEPSGDEYEHGYSTDSSNPWKAMGSLGPSIPAKSSPPASVGTAELALPSVDEVVLRGTAADSSGVEGLHGPGIQYGYADSEDDGGNTSDQGEDREEHACMMVDISEDDSFARNQDKLEKL